MSDKLKDAALIYHQYPTPGKVRIQATKPLINQRDLALAYSPGVAAACEEIDADPDTAALYTSRSNLVAVITNGTAVLGLGNIGPLASKPVMEGKAILFKHFADVDAFDIEINETNVDKLVDIIASLEPTIGGINLEDIKAPECFEVERRLKEKLNIPVFHDDQHGTAIVTAAAVRNALKLVGKNIEDCRLVVNGAGAAAIACTNMLVVLGLQKKNIMMLDRTGVIHAGRDNLTAEKQGFVVDTEARTLEDAMQGADIFLGLSVGNVLSEDMLKSMAKSPIILAMANPTPEVMPDIARRIRPDCVIATGRSDFPNQVNNVLCFPFLFRGALDVGASTINDQMKLACVNAIADIALAESSEVATSMYSEQKLVFGYDYILPKPFDHRLITSVAGAVAQAAMDSGVATRQIDDMAAYRRKLQKLIFRSGTIMKPLFEMAANAPKRVLYTSGENEQVLRAVQVLVDDNLAKPVLMGRRSVIEQQMSLLGLRFVLDKDVELIDPSALSSEYFDDLGNELHEIRGRNGVSRQAARRLVQSRYSILGNLLLKRGEVDALLVGPVNRYGKYLSQLQDINGLQQDISVPATMQLLTFDQGTYFIADTGVTEDPDAEQLAEITMLAASKVRRFGFTPKVALLSSSNYGSRKESKSGIKMRKTLEILKQKAPDLEVDGEMNADVALDPQLREAFVHDATLKGRANLLIMPNLDAANITYKALKVIAESVAVGPILLGIDKPAHVIENNATSRSIVNLSTLAVVDANKEKVK